MQAKATITKVETRVGTQSQKEFTVVDLAENFFSGEDRQTTYWRGLIFNKDELRALLKKGQFVEFTGQVQPKNYTKGDGTPGIELSVRIFSLKILSEPKPRTENGETAGNAAQSQPSAQGQKSAPPESQGLDDDASYERYSQMVDSNFA
jgi:single-stranded DNA-binding protein